MLSQICSTQSSKLVLVNVTVLCPVTGTVQLTSFDRTPTETKFRVFARPAETPKHISLQQIQVFKIFKYSRKARQ
jgi:hypothetical protein